MAQVLMSDGGGGGLTSGFDPKAAADLLSNKIYPEIIKKAQEVLSKDDGDFQALETAFDLNWKGEAKGKFLKKLEKSIKDINDQLTFEYFSLYNRFYEMERSFDKFDKDQSGEI